MQIPLKYHGGKFYLAERIVGLMPPHSRYLEAYVGGASVLLAKPHEGIAEYANDLNGQLTNFWRVLRSPTNFPRFERLVQATPLSETEYRLAEGYRSILFDDPEGDVWAAVGFFVRARQSRQGLGKDYCTPTSRLRRGMNENASAWLSAIDGLADVHQRLRRVEIWNRPALAAIEAVDHADTLLYLDPPYVHSTRRTKKEYRQFEMATADHVELLELLLSVKSRFILSGYECPIYTEAAKKGNWHVERIEIPNNASAKKKKETKVECLWMNYEPAKAAEPEPVRSRSILRREAAMLGKEPPEFNSTSQETDQ